MQTLMVVMTLCLAILIVSVIADGHVANIMRIRDEEGRQMSFADRFRSPFKTRKPPAADTRLGQIYRFANYGIAIGLVGIVGSSITICVLITR